MKKIILCLAILSILIIPITALTVDISSPNEGQTFSSTDEDILVYATVDAESTCDVWGWITTSAGRNDISPKDCDICSKSSGGIYANSVSAYFDAVAGGTYEIHVVCSDQESQSDSKIVNFEVEGESEDNEAPIITINSPTNGASEYSTLTIDFEVNEPAHCEYSNTPGDNNDDTGIAFSGYINNKQYEVSFKQNKEYSLTVTCEDLTGNSASETVSFSTKDRACESCAVPPTNGGTPNNGGGGSTGGGCYDTDGGKDLYTKGIAAGIADSCISESTISERYCTENNAGANYIMECTVGYICSDGACILAPETPEELVEKPNNEIKPEDNNDQVIEPDNNCQLNSRKDTLYCSSEGLWMEQKNDNESCQNNYECKSNFCSEGQCYDIAEDVAETQSFVAKIAAFLKSIFGFE